VKHAITKLIIAALMLAAWPVAAELLVGEMAKLVTESTPPSECLAPVVITSIDGVRQALPGKGFLIEPGAHSLNGQAILDTRKCRRPEGDLKISRADDLVVNFEAGNTYYIAYDRSAQNSAEWKLLVWKVEQAGSTLAYPEQ